MGSWVGAKAWLRVWGVARGVAAIMWRAVSIGGAWLEVQASPGLNPEPTVRRHSYLRARGVRCRLRNLGGAGGRGGGYTGMVSLRVHRDDLNRAYTLLTEIRE